MNDLVDFIKKKSQVEVYIFDAETLKIVFANDVAESNLGYSLEELQGLTPANISLNASVESVKASLPLSKSANHNGLFLNRTQIRKDGSSYPVEACIQLMEYSGVPSYISFNFDSSERQQELDRFRQVIKGAQLGFWDFNNAAGVYYTDDNWLAIVGLKQGDLKNDPIDWQRFIHPDDKEWMFKRIDEAIKEDDSYQLEFRMLHKDGRIIWVQSSGAVVGWDHLTKMPSRVCGTHLDISERKKNELEKEQFLHFFELSTDIMVICDPFGKFIKVNPATFNILGYEEEELVSNPFVQFIYEEDVELTQQEMKNQVAIGSSQNFENRYVCKDGSLRWLSWTASHDKEEGITYATGRDITDQKIVEQQLKRQVEMQSALLDNSQDMITLHDRQHRCIYINPIVETILGYSQDYCKGKTSREMGYPEELCVLKENAIENVFVHGEPENHTFEIGDVDKKRYIDWHVFPGLLNSHGKVASVFSVSRDVSTHRRTENELQKMQRLNSLGVLAGGIAHDFNNILTILFGNISLAKDQLDNSQDCLESLGNAEKAFQRASQLTSQLLTFAKGGDPLIQDINLAYLVNEVANFDLSGSKVKLSLGASESLWMAKADKGQIAQVFSNLTTNANQAMPYGGTLSISMVNAQITEGQVTGVEAGRYIKVSVCDEGMGIKDENLSKIFDPFYSTKESGSGLGLATVYSIIQKHGGYINVTSNLGEGTYILFYLPASDTLPYTELPEPMQISSNNGTNRKVLIMDDEEMIREFAVRILTHDGYDVDTAINGDEAIALVNTAAAAMTPYSCIIMDLTIPGGMGGEEAVTGVLALQPDAKVVVTSGYAAHPVMARFSDYGFTGVIAKPFTKDDLRKVVGD